MSLWEQAALQHRTAPSGSWIPLLGGCAVAAAVFLLIYVLLTPPALSRRERRLATVQPYLHAVLHGPKETHERMPSAVRVAVDDLAERFMNRRSSTDRTMQLIERADLPLRAGQWLVLRVLAVVFGGTLGWMLLGHAAAVGALLGVITGYFLPSAVVRLKAARRTRAFEKQLPQVLALVGSSLRSGFGLPQALDAVARDAAEPTAKELSRALAQVRIGSDIADALDDAATRMGTESLHMTVMAIRIQRQVGGNLAETLETTVHTLRDREALRGQVASLSAEGRLSAWILIALPIGLFLYMLAVNEAYIALLWTTAVGLVALIASIVLLIIGVFWMRKLVRIEV